MSTVERERERERDLDRLLTFVDAIVAIAITLLVLPLVELTADLGEIDGVGELLREHSGQLWSFALSFYVIARFWLSQHDAVSPLLVGNRRITVLLIAWTFTIVALPFPTALVAIAGEEALTKMLYVGTMTVSLLLIALVRAEVGRHPELTDAPPHHRARRGLISAGLLVLALAIMLLAPVTSYFPILLLTLDGVVEWVLAARNRRAT